MFPVLGLWVGLAALFGAVFILPSSVGPASASTVVQVHSAAFGTVDIRISRRSIAHGRIDWAQVPIFVPVVSHGETVGYVQKIDIDGQLPVIGPENGGTYTPVCGSNGINVYSSNDVTVIGAVYPGVGFVLNGQVPNCSGVVPTTSIPAP